MRAFAERLIAHETRGNKSSGINGPAAYHVFGKLRPHLATLMGNLGFRGLITRALALACVEEPWLRVVRVKEDGTLEGFDGTKAPADAEKIAEGSEALTAQFFGLLVAFIGENLTQQMAREIWPKLSFSNFDKGD